MERPKLRRRILKTSLALCVVFALITSALALFAEAESTGWLIVAAKTATAALKGISMGYTISTYNSENDEFSDYKDRYKDDHKELESGSRVWRDAGEGINALYGILADGSASEALTFEAALTLEKFQAQFPGYRSASAPPVDYASDDKKRMGNWQDYAFKAIRANNDSAMSIKTLQPYIERMKDASLSASYYRQVLQAGNQISVGLAQEITELGVDAQRQLEFRTVVTLQKIQDEINEDSAFEQGIRVWQQQAPGLAY
jgi:hypothetical protein